MAESEKEEDVYCLCRRPYQESEFMIECDVCKDWFHGSCVGIEEHQSTDIDNYHCPNCQPEHGPLTLKRRRNWHRHDYSEINDGRKAVQSGTVTFVKNLKKKKFICADGEVLLHLKGSEVTLDYFEKHGFSTPLLVETKDGLGLKVPPEDFTVADVERCVGSMRELDVIDVARQDDMRMKMREWTDYYEDTKGRSKVLNVISLEFTGTDLAKLVSPPLVVRKIDWINNHWPDSLPEESLLSRPLVQKYCLMGVKNSYTDFHVDFGGTSVWYHVLRGQKVFYLIPPTEENLIRYEEWVSSSDQSELFFGDMVPHCYEATINEGNTLFIPTGWIHAVLTPLDSLVFGGNFLHRYGIGMQLRIYEMELRLNTPLKFRHPCYEALTWFAARNYLQEIKGYVEEGSEAPYYLVEGLKEAIFSFSEWTRTREGMKVHGAQVPADILPSRLIEQLSNVLEKARTNSDKLSADVEQEGVGTRTRRQRVSPRRDRVPQGRRGLRREGLTAVRNQRKSITLKLAKSERKVVRRTSSSGEHGEQTVALKLPVPEAKVVASSLNEEREGEGRARDRQERLNSCSSEGSLHINDDTTPSPNERQSSEYEATPSPVERRRLPRRRGRGEDEDYKDGDYVYPTLDEEEEEEESSGSGSGITSKGAGPGRKRHPSGDQDDMLWKPHGPVHLIKGSIAGSSRENRHAKKRSFEHSMSATAAKILKMEHEKETRPEETSKSSVLFPSTSSAEVSRSRQADPIIGGGALKVEVMGDNGRVSGEGEDKGQRSRAAAAANAVDAMLKAARPKSKLLTPKQRLGKLLGLNKRKI